MGSKSTKTTRKQCAEISMLLGGIFLVLLGVAIFIFINPIYDLILNQALKFTPDSQAFKAWRINDPPLDLDLYLFNWTNPKDIYNSSVKPHFKEVGPYRVKEVKEKTNLSWNDNNHTISYMVRKLYHFIPENSPRHLDHDNITTINTVPLTLSWQSKDKTYFRRRMLSISASSLSKMYVTATARDILFNGYSDGLLSMASRLPGMAIQDKFGIFYKRNGTIGEGVFSMYTKNDENFGRQLTWDYKNTTNLYKGHCNDIKGSATEFYPLNVNKNQKLVFYSPELCKYAELEFVREEVVKGVRGYRFTGDNIFANAEERPENACFYKEEQPSGILDVSKCRKNSPSFLSFPHFHAADPYYRTIIDGMVPNRTQHEFYIVIEPKSGIIMEIGANMQLNMLLQPDNVFLFYKNVSKIYVPIFYFSQHIGLKDDLAASLRLIQNMPEFLMYASLFFVSLGIILLIWSACSIFNVCQPKEKKEQQDAFEEIPLKR